MAVGGAAPTVDGNLLEWPEMSWARLDDRASAAVRIVGDRLYAAWRTGDPSALANAIGEPKLMFKRGGAVDVMLGTDPKADPNRRVPVAGDLRLLATLQDSKPTAVLYRAVVPGTPDAQRVPFISPVGRVDFDRVMDKHALSCFVAAFCGSTARTAAFSARTAPPPTWSSASTTCSYSASSSPSGTAWRCARRAPILRTSSSAASRTGVSGCCFGISQAAR